MLNLFAQNKLGVFQGLVVEQPVQLRPLCRVLPYSSSTAMQSMARVVYDVRKRSNGQTPLAYNMIECF